MSIYTFELGMSEKAVRKSLGRVQEESSLDGLMLTADGLPCNIYVRDGKVVAVRGSQADITTKGGQKVHVDQEWSEAGWIQTFGKPSRVDARDSSEPSFGIYEDGTATVAVEFGIARSVWVRFLELTPWQPSRHVWGVRIFDPRIYGFDDM